MQYLIRFAPHLNTACILMHYKYKISKIIRTLSYIIHVDVKVESVESLIFVLDMVFHPMTLFLFFCASSRGGGGCPGGPDFCPFWYRPNCALKFFNKFRRDALKNQFKKQKNQSKRCTNSILLKLFTPVRLIYSHSLLRNIISYRTDVNANFYCTENNLSNFCMIIRENKKKMFHF